MQFVKTILLAPFKFLGALSEALDDAKRMQQEWERGGRKWHY